LRSTPDRWLLVGHDDASAGLWQATSGCQHPRSANKPGGFFCLIAPSINIATTKSRERQAGGAIRSGFTNYGAGLHRTPSAALPLVSPPAIHLLNEHITKTETLLNIVFAPQSIGRTNDPGNR